MMKRINVLIILILIGVVMESCDTPKKDVAVISTKFGDMVVEFFD